MSNKQLSVHEIVGELSDSRREDGEQLREGIKNKIAEKLDALSMKELGTQLAYIDDNKLKDFLNSHFLNEMFGLKIKILMALGDTRAAFTVLGKLENENKSFIAAALAYELYDSENYKDAISFFLLSLESTNEDKQGMYLSLAISYEVVGQIQDAEKNYLLAVEGENIEITHDASISYAGMSMTDGNFTEQIERMLLIATDSSDLNIRQEAYFYLYLYYTNISEIEKSLFNLEASIDGENNNISSEALALLTEISPGVGKVSIH